MKQRKAVAAVLLAAVCMCSLAGCGDQERPTYEESEMPYGATMRQNKTDFAVPMTYDRRFLDEDQVRAAAAVIGAVQDMDAEQYRSSTFDFYADYQLSVYEADNAEALMQKIHERLAEQSGDDFTFSMVLIDGVSENRDKGDLNTAMTLLGDLYQGEGKFSEKIEGAWELSMEWDITYENGQKALVLNDRHVCLFKTADGYYAVM